MAEFSLKNIYLEIDEKGNAELNLRYGLSFFASIGYDLIGISESTIESFVDFDRFPDEVEVNVQNVSKSGADIRIENYAEVSETDDGRELTSREIDFSHENLPDVPFSIDPVAREITLKFPDGYEEKMNSSTKVPKVTRKIA